MTAVAQRKCLHHPSREAAARCPSCRRFFCRECVTEHEGRLACADCLKRTAAQAERKRVDWRAWLRPAWAVTGFLLAWMAFYYGGYLLSRLPGSTHAGGTP